MSQQFKATVAVLLVALLGYVVYVELAGKSLIPGGAPALGPEPDTAKLADLKAVQSISVTGVLGAAGPAYDQGGRNVFQYGVAKPPPPTPAELEAMRKAEEARLKTLEEEARQRAEIQQKQAQEDNERRAREAAEALKRQQELAQAQAKAAPPAPSGPTIPPPPPINYRLVGYLGPKDNRIAVLMNGNDVVLGARGDVIEGKFRVLSIGIDSVEIGYSDPVYKDAKKRIDLGT
ncbi:MAG TPA: hypothetical protein VE404_08235 [Verrucomicrobiae bacterium]|nr:hypothetical protein [Verrucomicrobiae bacterium]